MKLSSFLFLLGLAIPVSAEFQIEPWTASGGDGVSTGGPYTLAGTIGQSDTALSSAGNYTLVGGFWGGAYQGPVPRLSITLPGENTVLHWPSWATGWVPLMKDTVAPPTAWTLVPETPVLVGNEFTVTLPVGANAKFFHLWLP
jgi:hypothetical protein